MLNKYMIRNLEIKDATLVPYNPKVFIMFDVHLSYGRCQYVGSVNDVVDGSVDDAYDYVHSLTDFVIESIL